jgi:hypothetical protein
MSFSDFNNSLYVLHFMGFDHAKLCLLALKSSDATTSPFMDLGTADPMKG